MSVKLSCPACHKRVSATEDVVGRVVVCPHCGKRFTCPRPGEQAIPIASPLSSDPAKGPPSRTDSSRTSPPPVHPARANPDGTLPAEGDVSLMAGAAADITSGLSGDLTRTGPADPVPPIGVESDLPRASVVAVRFAFICQRCASNLEANSAQCGSKGSCPTCGAVFTIPGVDYGTRRALAPAVVEDDGQLPTPMHAYATSGAKAPQVRRLSTGEQVIVCPRCGAEMPVDANVCRRCGLPFTIEGTAEIAQPGPEGNGMATAALTVGILSILSFCIPGPGVVAIWLGYQGIRRSEQFGQHGSGYAMSVVGMVCGFAATALFVGKLLLF